MIACAQKSHRTVVAARQARRCEQAEVEPFLLPDEPDEPSELDDPDEPWSDDRWDVFLPDDDPYESLPEPGDFWIDVDGE